MWAGVKTQTSGEQLPSSAPSWICPTKLRFRPRLPWVSLTESGSSCCLQGTSGFRSRGLLWASLRPLPAWSQASMETFPTRPLQLIPRYFSPVLRETGSVKPDSALEELCGAKCVHRSPRLGHLEACSGAGCDVPSHSLRRFETAREGS